MSRKQLLFSFLLLFAFTLPGWSQNELPEGKGKEIVQSACVACHSLDRVFNANFDAKDWDNAVDMMVNAGAAVPPDQIEVVKQYLTKSFPMRPWPTPVVVPGPESVSFKEWTVPTRGSRPHDPLAAPDGTIWYAGQFANVLGHLDPKTGEFKEYHPKIAHSGPHALIMDKAGNIWFTANFKGYIGRLDPKTGEVTAYRLPDPKARDPHTLIMDQAGTIWFTVQQADRVGRLQPSTGEIKLLPVPTPNARPYGIAVNSQGVPFFVEFGSNKIGRIDPKTLEIREYTLPHEDSRPRRLAITPDGAIWYTDYSRGYLGKYDPKTGSDTEWASPGGPKSEPYGISIAHGEVWYSEAGVRPNTLVRFNPRTQKFQSWEIPSGGKVVRNMVTTRDQELLLACSGVNGLALAKVSESSESRNRPSHAARGRHGAISQMNFAEPVH